jgi:pSer/pThr/pTyr-binding forkhead associated (FHA) protein
VRAELIGSAGVVLGQGYTLDARIVTIGRRRDNTIVIKHPTVSRHHAEIRRQGDDFVIVDRGSTSGVVVNGQTIKGEQILHDGDRISIGIDAIFLVQLHLTDDEHLGEARPMSDSATFTVPIKPAVMADLRIQIDNARREQQVDEIVETEYFQQLRDSAERLRSHPPQQHPKEGDPT